MATPKLKIVDWAKIAAWFENNPRTDAGDVGDAAYMKKVYDRPDMRASLVQNGLIEPLGLMIGDPKRGQDPEKLYVIKGNTRYYNLKILIDNGITESTDGKHSLVKLSAMIFEPMDDAELKRVTHDHGHRGLNQYQVAMALEGDILANPGKTDKEIVWGERMLIDGAHAVDTKKAAEFDNPELAEDKRKDLYFNYRKGLFQTIKRCATGPLVMRDEHFKGLKDGTKFLRQDDIKEMEAIYKEELEADVTGKINRSNPGEKFLARWQKYLSAKAEALAAGDGGKVKPTSMAGRDAVTQGRNTAQSRVIKLTANCFLRENNFDVADLPVIDKAAVAFETGNVPEGTRILDELVAKKAVNTPPTGK